MNEPKFPSDRDPEAWAKALRERLDLYGETCSIGVGTEWFKAAMDLARAEGAAQTNEAWRERLRLNLQQFRAQQTMNVAEPAANGPGAPRGRSGFKCPQCGTMNCWGTTDWPGEPMKGHCHGWLPDGSRCKFEWVRSDERDLELGITNEAPEFYATGSVPRPPEPKSPEAVAPDLSAPLSSGKHPLDRLKERIDRVDESFDDFRVEKIKQLAALADQGRMHEKNIDALDAGLVELQNKAANMNSRAVQDRIDLARGLKMVNARLEVLEKKSGGDWSKRLEELEKLVSQRTCLIPVLDKRLSDLEGLVHRNGFRFVGHQGMAVKNDLSNVKRIEAIEAEMPRVAELERRIRFLEGDPQ